jgi:hypothetical protein
MSDDFRLPGAADRTVVMGATGTGKTIFGAWILSRQNFEKRPWVIIDYKGEELFYKIGTPPLKRLKLGDMPGKKGIYIMSPKPGEEEATEDWLWKIWAKENIGIFCDEVSLIPDQNAFKAILRQGRSKRIPVISCTQRPVDVNREVFTEASYMSIFRLQDERDYKIVRGFTGKAPIHEPIVDSRGDVRAHWSYWFDVARNKLFTLRPCPAPATVAAEIKAKAPYSVFFGS